MASVFSDDIAIDLGTVNTLVHVIGRGIILDEPSAVAVSNSGGRREVLAVGLKAKGTPGRAPENIEVIRPLRDGVIADFVATEEMLRQFIKRTKTMLGFRRPRILVCVPAGATPVERRAVYESALSAGSRRVYLLDEPVAAAIGAGMPVDEPIGSMVIDIGGGTTDIGVLSLGGVLQARSLRCAGNAMDEAIIRYVRRQHQLLIGELNAERIKIEAGSALVSGDGRDLDIHIRGRDLRQGRAKSIVLGPADIAEALDGPIELIAEFIQRSLEDLPPEVSADICSRGICLTGGGSLLDGLDQELEARVGVEFFRPDNPMHCVIRGAAKVMEHLGDRSHLLLTP
ncbi:cell wall structural complex MreBCD, actin-like component MreB [Candidatus Filomicrobium marinum]|uniref:Cell shape-determining protein MreB n=1 Tax=Candidatus Filomicrobium marinum TaxID=1608628 RepID=A0A0D6JJM8_9HYPH|nr:rod shape-determining protein [Candidatus Filomicrobium marinum]CFX34319.1 cell wall structural complex MreBCD, actin-like component MreB [Candidatus Filomicrobium marinum]CPR21865.1 cell wall structural complex MreBCD, actin-like component MreB [Candidatus Filomicrobium marinum]